MGRPPAVVVIARHGARLDAADKQWHLTSPTPYDPPLTYGGWTQSRALGARIGALLHARESTFEETADESNQSNTHGAHSSSRKPRAGKRKKHKIIIHSSPFLRCIQTSVAISAGLSQYHGLNTSSQTQSNNTSSKSPQKAPSEAPPEVAENSKTPHLAIIPDAEGNTEQQASKPKPFTKSRLRLDAFLGEWLSPDYYEAITPPPGSILMIASAKAELLRRGEHIDTTEDTTSMKGHFPGGWSSTNKQNEEDASTSSLSPGRDRAKTIGSGESVGVTPPLPGQAISLQTPLGYTPPVPRHAVAPPDPIPAGYVAHARDACIEVDYQWDSTRAPQDWGDGGEYGEEWSAMHKRFRKGLGYMIKWYKLHRESARQASGHKRILHPHDDEDDENTDTVLVLVTHGAGCNALIGALTNQPVLMDVGMASLTMAVRKEDASTNSSLSSSNGTLYEQNLSNDYSVLLTASTEHLRTGSSPMSMPSILPPKHASTFPHHSHTQSASPRIPPYRYRPGNTTFPSIGAAATAVDSPSESPFTLPESFSRFTVAGHVRSASTATSRTSSGLWSKPGSESSPKLLPRQDEFSAGGGMKMDSDGGEEDALPALGLWGTTSGEVQERERGFKRRWTVTDRGDINSPPR